MTVRLLVALVAIVTGAVFFSACSGSDSVTVAEPGPDASLDSAPPSRDAAPNDAGSDDPAQGLDADVGYAPTIVTTPISGLADDTWQWVPLEGALCRDGSATGIGVNIHARSTNLLIMIQGGGSCEVADKCASTPLSYGAADFASNFGPLGHANSILDRTLATNPVKDWNMVFVPYCTGDQHGGNAPGAHPADFPTPQQYVGYVDMTLALARLAPTFPNVAKVLLSGDSAGGAGVLHNYLQTARSFPNAVVDALDDSAPPMSAMYASACLQDYWAKLWRFDRTSRKDCGAACATTDGAALAMQKYVAQTYPSSTFGVVESAWDENISRGYAYGANDCAALVPGAPKATRISATTFAAGLADIHTAMSAHSNFGLYVFAGEDHTSIQSAMYASRTSKGVSLTSWVGALVDGTATNVSP